MWFIEQSSKLAREMLQLGSVELSDHTSWTKLSVQFRVLLVAFLVFILVYWFSIYYDSVVVGKNTLSSMTKPMSAEAGVAEKK